jgi:hypothetical protein
MGCAGGLTCGGCGQVGKGRQREDAKSACQCDVSASARTFGHEVLDEGGQEAERGGG